MKSTSGQRNEFQPHIRKHIGIWTCSKWWMAKYWKNLDNLYTTFLPEELVDELLPVLVQLCNKSSPGVDYVPIRQHFKSTQLFYLHRSSRDLIQKNSALPTNLGAYISIKDHREVRRSAFSTLSWSKWCCAKTTTELREETFNGDRSAQADLRSLLRSKRLLTFHPACSP